MINLWQWVRLYGNVELSESQKDNMVIHAKGFTGKEFELPKRHGNTFTLALFKRFIEHSEREVFIASGEPRVVLSLDDIDKLVEKIVPVPVLGHASRGVWKDKFAVEVRKAHREAILDRYKELKEGLIQDEKDIERLR